MLFFLVAGGYFLQQEQFRQQQRRIFAFEEASGHAKSIERVVAQALSAPGLLTAVLHSTSDLDRFDDAAARILQFNEGLTALQLAPGGLVWRSYSPPGRSLGQLLPHPEAPPQPKEDLVLEAVGSVLVNANTAGMIVSQPIHARSKTAGTRFWGYAIAILGSEDLGTAARIDELAKEGFDYELAFRRRSEPQTITFFRSSPAPLADPIVQSFTLGSGDSIELSLIPKGGWQGDPFFIGELSLVGVASVLLGVLLHFILRQPGRLHESVDQRTRELESALESLNRNNAALDSVLENLPLMLLLKRAGDFEIERTNRFAEALLGRDRAHIVGSTTQALIAGDAAARLLDLDRQSLAERRPLDLQELEIQTPEGTRTLNVRAVPLFDERGEPAHVLELAEDISERKLLAAGIRKQLGFLEQLIDSIPTPVFLKDGDSHYLNINRAFEQMLGRSRDEIIGDGRTGGPASIIADGQGEIERRLLTDGRSQSFEATVDCADGRRRDALFHEAVFRDEYGDITGIVGSIIDISERTAAERRIAQINRTFAVLSGINETIVRVRERGALLTRACEILVELGRFPLAWIYFIDDDGRTRTQCIAGAPTGLAEATLAAIRGSSETERLPGESMEPTHFFWAAGTPVNDVVAPIAAIAQLAALAIIPLKTDEGCVGGIAIFAHEADAFNDDERKLLGDLADDISHGLTAITQEERRLAAEKNLRLAAQVFENSSEGIMITDSRNEILAVNKTFTAVTGYAAAEVIGRNPRILSSGQQDAEFYKAMWQSIQKRGEWHGEVQNRRKSGEFYTEWLTISAVRNDEGRITNYVAIFSDITSTKQIEERLNFLANFDTLTLLPNRVLFTDRLSQAIETARAEHRSVAVMFLDLDRFSLINETFGHAGGDFVLKEIAVRLQSCVRKGDSVSRLGGDQFALILGDLEAPDDAAPVAGKVMQALGERMVIEGQDTYTSASIGISVFPDDGDDVQALVRNADSAMYRAMEEGRNTFRFYHQEMNARSSERMSLEAELRHALERGELEVHYQPFIDARSGRIVGAEALLRWHRPGIGYITPAAFIPLLEETGLIVPVGEWALRRACEDNAAWRKSAEKLFVAVNFSALQLADGNIGRRVGDMLSDMGFPARHLEIELTESMVMRDAERGIRTLHQFREIGTRLSVDDFGTGYSSLSYLKRLPIDTLKIDRSFIVDTPVESEANAIVQAIIAMGHSLGLQIIAEGVQEEDQAAFLRHARCDLLQGFYFSTAVSQNDFLKLIDQPRCAWHEPVWSDVGSR